MIVTNRRKVKFYTHVVVTTPQDRSLHCRIWHYGERLFPSKCTASFWAFLLPAGIVEVAVAICFQFLISFKLLCSFVATELESGNNSYMYTSECCLDGVTRVYFLVDLIRVQRKSVLRLAIRTSCCWYVLAQEYFKCPKKFLLSSIDYSSSVI